MTSSASKTTGGGTTAAASSSGAPGLASTEPGGACVGALECLVEHLERAATQVRELVDSPFDDLLEPSSGSGPTTEVLAGRLFALRTELLRDTDLVLLRLRELAERTRARARYTPEGVTALLAALSHESRRKARRRWLAEVSAALAAGEHEAVRLLLRQAPEAVAAGSGALRELGEAPDGDDAEVDLRIASALQEAFWEEVAAAHAVRSSLAVVQARAHVSLGRPADARAVLDEAASSSGDAGIQAERAFLLAATGEPEAAQEAVAAAAAIDPRAARVLLAEGFVSEHQGNHVEADDLYTQAVATLDITAVENPGRASLLSPTGMLRLHLARRLERTGLTRAAVAEYRRAVETGVAGPGLYADAAAFEGMARLLPRTGADADAQQVQDAAYEGGRRFLWRDDPERATPLLRLAVQAGARRPRAGYYLANALLQSSWSRGTQLPDPTAARVAEATWSQWYADVGPPGPTDAWAYAVGSRCASVLAAFEEDSIRWTWQGLLRAEKGIVADGRDGSCWGESIGSLRRLNLEALALEAAWQAADLDPEVAQPQRQLMALLANAGHVSEAAEILDRLQGADTDSWLLGVRGWLRLHEGDAAAGVQDLTRALELDDFERGWNLFVRASALTRLGRLDEAQDDLEGVVADVDQGPAAQLRRGVALTMLGRAQQASEVLSMVDAGDPLLDQVAFREAQVPVLVMLGNVEAAEAGYRELTASLRVDRERLDVVDTWGDAAALLRRRGLDQQAQRLEELAERMTTEQVRPARTGEDELLAAMQRHPDPHSEAGAALVAVRARRLAAAGDSEAAAEEYRRLQGGPFDPEATEARGEQLTRALSAAVKDRDTDRAVALHRQLAALGRSPFASEELLTAAVRREDGETSSLRDTLSRAVAVARDVASAFPAILQLGEAQVKLGDRAAGLQTLTRAQQTATENGDTYGAARAHARIGALLVTTGNHGDARAHFQAALSHFVATGISNLSTALAIEIQRAQTSMGLEGSKPQLRAALESVLGPDAGDARAAPDADVPPQRAGQDVAGDSTELEVPPQTTSPDARVPPPQGAATTAGRERAQRSQ